MKISVEIKPDPKKEKDPCEVEIFLDQEGLDYFIREVQRLRQPGDHFHMMTPSWGMDDLSEERQINESILAHHLKITLI